jgi:hypothetical protein
VIIRKLSLKMGSIALLCALFCCTLTAKGSAATPAPAPAPLNGISVSPAVQQVQLAPNQASVTFDTTITNNTASSLVLSVSDEDFTALNQTGSIVFLPTQTINTNANTHGLASNLAIGLTQVALLPHQSQAVPVTVTNANQLAVGGHYAAIVFQAGGQAKSGGANVNINEAVSSLVFVSTYGQGTQSLSLGSVGLSRFNLNFPTSVSAVLSDSGNTQTSPVGYIKIVNAHGAVISRSQINTNSNLILPGSSRLFNFGVTKLKKHILPGVYKLDFYYQTPGQTGYTMYTRQFIYLGWPLLIIVMAVVLLVLAFLIWKFVPSRYYRIR